MLYTQKLGECVFGKRASQVSTGYKLDEVLGELPGANIIAAKLVNKQEDPLLDSHAEDVPHQIAPHVMASRAAHFRFSFHPKLDFVYDVPTLEVEFLDEPEIASWAPAMMMVKPSRRAPRVRRPDDLDAASPPMEEYVNVTPFGSVNMTKASALGGFAVGDAAYSSWYPERSGGYGSSGARFDSSYRDELDGGISGADTTPEDLVFLKMKTLPSDLEVAKQWFCAWAPPGISLPEAGRSSVLSKPTVFYQHNDTHWACRLPIYDAVENYEEFLDQQVRGGFWC